MSTLAAVCSIVRKVIASTIRPDMEKGIRIEKEEIKQTLFIYGTFGRYERLKF